MCDTNKGLVSVIVPMYNVAKHLPKCVESIIKQSYSNLEILLVNDKSTDDTVVVATQFMESDSRIKLIQHDSNQGVSAARNNGIKSCKGDYIIFVDADDYLHPNMIEKLICRFGNETDIVCCGYRTLHPDKIDINKPNVGTYSDIHAIRELVTDYGFFTAVWNKMFLGDFLRDSNILFDSKIAIGEDYWWLVQVISVARQIEVFDDTLYDWIMRDGSAVSDINTKLSEKSLTAIDANEEVCDFIQSKYGSDNDVYTEAVVRLLDLIKTKINISTTCGLSIKKELKKRGKTAIGRPIPFKVKLKYKVMFLLHSSKMGIGIYNCIHGLKKE